MATLLRCKSCGFLIEEAKLGDVCPACGVPRKLFEPWEDPVSSSRRRILALDIHPIVVHFPVSFAVAGFLVVLFALLLPNVLAQPMLAISQGLLVALPVLTAAAMAAGIFDGKVRFKKVGTPLLRRKIVMGSVFLLSSVAALLLTLLVDASATWGRIVVAVLLASCVFASIGLGRIGAKLLCAAMRG